MNISPTAFTTLRRAALAGAAAVLLAAAMMPARADEGVRRKKLIATGWDNPDTARLRQNLALMEQRPFDGVFLVANGRIDEKRSCSLRGAFVATRWERAWFKNCVEDLKACKFTRFTDNFVSVGANPGNVDWFDDAGWRNVVEHWRIAAWIAREGRLKGILFDPEPYTQPFAQFSYRAQAGREKHTFAEYRAKARQRGAEVMRAVAKEYPGITLYCYFMNIVNAQALGQGDPSTVLQGSGYGLYPAFIDGWLDAAPPTVSLVDGCENAYLYNSTAQYLESALLIKGGCQELVSPENRAKYRAQVQVSFGMYLDAYWNPATSPWRIDLKGEPAVGRLRANTSTALRVADEYVWIYGEKFRWWPTPNTGVKPESWPEALPGCDDALFFSRSPEEYGRAKLATLEKEGKLVDLARNGGFGSDKAAANTGAAVDWKEGSAPAGWSTWQESASKGSFTWDRETGHAGKGSARAANVGGGCFIQSYDVKPGERYVVRAARRIHGAGSATIRARWQTPEGKWTMEERDRIASCQGPADAWGEICGVAEVPEGVGKLVLLLGMGGQSSAEDIVWFDDVRVNRLE